MTKAKTTKPAAETAYALLRDRILSGELAPGTRVTEAALATTLHLSRTPVREAMRRLMIEGFMERGEGYNTRVAGVSPEELQPMFEVRTLLESYAAGRAALLADDKEISGLRRLAERMLAHTPPKTPEDYRVISTENEAFHRMIYSAARAPRLAALLSMAVNVGVVARTYYQYSEADLIRSANQHVEIVESIAAHSPGWASSIMSAHIQAAATVTLNAKTFDFHWEPLSRHPKTQQMKISR